MTPLSSGATTSPASEEHAPESARAAAAYLTVAYSVDAAQVGTRVALGDDLLLIGREQAPAGLELHDPRLSRVHARLGYDARNAAHRIGDAQSRNGTFVNMRLVETVLLGPGDVIRAGDTLLVYDEDDAMARLRAQAQAAAPLPATVLVRGETGTGKELLARAVHAQSGRSGAFVPVNCGSVPIDLLGAELFGHTRQAFSGASQARKGLFADAAGGTLFLDEIGDCPLPVQVALLRALQEKAVRPIGAEREVPIDVRVIAATHADLEDALAAGRFRHDLYARLAQVALRIPPLRARRAEIVALLTSFAAEQGFTLALSADAAEALLCWHWPYNVRELQALLNGCVVHGLQNGTLGLEALHAIAPHIAQPLRERKAAPEAERTAIRPTSQAASGRNQLRALLEAHDGNVSAVALALGKPRAQVYRWLKSMGLTAEKFRR